jgi:hypothetical protein
MNENKHLAVLFISTRRNINSFVIKHLAKPKVDEKVDNYRRNRGLGLEHNRNIGPATKYLFPLFSIAYEAYPQMLYHHMA